MVRLVFRPYTQVGRPICTSGPLRASTRVSSGFALPRHSSPSFGSYRTRSRSTSPTLRARRAGGAPGPEGPGSHLGRRAPALTFIAPRGFETSPPTRACVRLLGPCFKTGRVGCRHRRRPLTPWLRGPVPALATRRGWGALRTVRPGRDSRAGSGGPRPSRSPRPRRRRAGERAQRALGPRPREAARSGRGGAVKLAAGAASHLRPEPFLADPEPVAAHRRGGNAPGGGQPAPGRGPARGSPHTERPSLTRRVESPGWTARTPPVYLSTVSRPLELSLQSSFQLSLKVLVDYRSRAGI